MSAPDFANLFFPSNKKLALVKKIIQKTREGKIIWQRTPNGSSAYVPGVLKMSFIESSWATFFSTRWVIFVVRDEVGTELLKVENESSAVPGPEPLPEPLPLPSTPQSTPTSTIPIPSWFLGGDPLVNAATELYNLVRQEGQEGVDRAIDFLDKI